MNLLFLLIALSGALSTYFLAKRNYFDGIRASASLSIIAYLILQLCDNEHIEVHSLLFFGATFIGMSAPKRFGIYSLFIASVMFVFLFESLLPYISHYGGALGLSAFLSICICHIGIIFGAPRSRKTPLD